MSKLQELKELREQLNMTVTGTQNYPDGPTIIIANHNCLMDIFYLPAALQKESISMISSRLLYKPVQDRQQMINRYLNAMPVEAHAGEQYAQICLQEGAKLLTSGISLNIFPEGVYLEDKSVIHRGKTGAARILYQSRGGGIKPYLLPVAIDIKSNNLDLDGYSITDDKINISILKPIDYEEEYEKYLRATNKEERNESLHRVVDKGLSSIAASLNKPYSMEYVKLWPRKDILFEGGNAIPIEQVQQENYIRLYKENLTKRTAEIQKRLIK